MGSRPAASEPRVATSSTPPFSTCLLSRPGGGPGLLLGGGGAGFFFGSACTSVIHGGSFLGAGDLSDSLGVPLGLGTGGSCSLPFTRPPLPPCSTRFSCCRLDRGRGVGGVGAVLSEAFLGAGVGRLAGGLASSCGLPGTRGLVGIWGRVSGLALGRSTSAPAATLGPGPPPSTSLASSGRCCCFGCWGGPGLTTDRPPGPSLAQCSAHTKVPSSGPFLYAPGSRVLEHRRHRKQCRWYSLPSAR